MPPTESQLPVRLVIDPDGAAFAPGEAAPSGTDVRFARWINTAGREYARGGPVGDRYRVHLYGYGHFVLTRHSDLVQGVPDPGVTPDVFRNGFNRKVLYWALVWNSWEVLHGCGMVVAGECIALCGRSEMGKSTLARAWRRRGGAVFADDAVPFRMEGASAQLCPLPFRLRPRPPGYRPDPTRISASKPFVDLEAAPALADTRLRALYIAERRLDDSSGPIRLEPARPLDALPEVLRHAYTLTLQLPTRNREMMATYITLVNTIPVYRLSYPTGIEY